MTRQMGVKKMTKLEKSMKSTMKCMYEYQQELKEQNL